MSTQKPVEQVEIKFSQLLADLQEVWDKHVPVNALVAVSGETEEYKIAGIVGSVEFSESGFVKINLCDAQVRKKGFFTP